MGNNCALQKSLIWYIELFFFLKWVFPVLILDCRSSLYILESESPPLTPSPHTVCEILISQPKFRTLPAAVEAWSLNRGPPRKTLWSYFKQSLSPKTVLSKSFQLLWLLFTLLVPYLCVTMFLTPKKKKKGIKLHCWWDCDMVSNCYGKHYKEASKN